MNEDDCVICVYVYIPRYILPEDEFDVVVLFGTRYVLTVMYMTHSVCGGKV